MSGVIVHGAFKFDNGRVEFLFSEFGDKPVEFNSIQSVMQLHQVLEAICNVGVAAGRSAFKASSPVSPEHQKAAEHLREVERQVAANITDLSQQLGEFHDKSKAAMDAIGKASA